MSAKLLEALSKLDIENDNHWTADGNPRLDTIKFLAGDQTITREQVVAAAPAFSRANPTIAPASAPIVAAPTSAQGSPFAAPHTATQAEINAGNPTLVGQATGNSMDGDGGSGEEPDALNAAIAKAQEELEVCRAAVNEAQASFNAAQHRLDALLDELESSGTKETTMDAIQGYLTSQRRVNAARHERTQKLREMGLGEMSPSKLDQSMRRKTGFGDSRPTVVKGGK